MRFESKAESLKRRLAAAEENLRLIRERKSEFVQQTNVPLELIKDERRLEHEIKALQAQLAQLPPPQEGAPPVSTRPRAWVIVAGVVGLVLVLVVFSVTLRGFPRWLAPPAEPSPVLLKLVDERFPGGSVRAIRPTLSGVLVALDREGIKRLSGQPLTLNNPDDLLVSPVVIAEGQDGRLWVGTYGNGLIELADGSVAGTYTQTTDGADVTQVNALALDSESRVWVGTPTLGPGVYLLDAERRWHTYPWEVGEECPVNDIKLDEEGGVWLATDGGGVRYVDPATGAWTVFDQLSCAGMDECLPSDYVLAIHIAVDGRKWVGTDEGLAVLDDREEQSWRVIDGLSHSCVVALAGDGEGRIFVGTADGLVIVDEELGVVEIQLIGRSLDGYINTLAFDPDQHKLWVGTVGQGLSIWSVEEVSMQ